MKTLVWAFLAGVLAVAAAAPSLAQNDDQGGPPPDGGPRVIRNGGGPGWGGGPGGPGGGGPGGGGFGGGQGWRGGPGGGGPGPGARGGPWGERGPDKETFDKIKKADDLRRQAQELSAKYRDTEPAGQDAVKKELRKTLGELFDANMAVKDALQKAMEKRNADIKARIAKQKKDREGMVDRRLDQMLGGENEDDAWN